MDGLSSAANVIAVIQLTGSLVKLCGGYIREVKDARDEILKLQRAAESLQRIFQDFKFLQDSNEKTLPTSSQLASDITDCLSDLQALEAKLDPGKGKKLMRKAGLRALKWPMKRTEVEGVIQNLERYKASFLLSLQVDQTSLTVCMAQNTKRMAQNMDFGKLEGVTEAEFDSFSDRDEDQCLEGTRAELLDQIMEWAMSPSQKPIFWLRGMAGTGKSTISRTVAGSLKVTNHLGASFFFKRGEGDRGNAKKFFPTLTRQLMLRIPGLQPSVQKVLDHDPGIISKSLREQFDKLLLQPLLNLNQLDRQPQTVALVIDALDECEHNKDVQKIIGLLPLLQKANAIHLRIFLTTRPEIPISLGFSELADDAYHDVALHEIPEEVTEHDIHLFLQDLFAKIKHNKNILQDWPNNDAIRILVTMSVPLFISAATVCRYIENSRLEPRLRLIELLADQAKYVSKMDKTYLPILTRLLDDPESDESDQKQLMQEFQDIVGVIILLAVPLSINALSVFLGISADQISNRLDSFRSVLSIPGDRDQPVRILHLSFRDFLVRSETKFLIEESRKHKEIANLCLKTMWSCLQKDICNLESPGTLRADIDPRNIRRCLPPELHYSCRYWIHHFKQSHALFSETADVLIFLQKHFLHWVEAMSLLGLISEVVGMLDLLHTLISGEENAAMFDFLQDGKRFILKNSQIADEAPLQVYCAGLVFAPRTAIVREMFKSELPNWICRFPQVDERWSAELQALDHTNWVWSVAFSPDGRLLASASDRIVQLWDPATGALQQLLGGHTGQVRSVAFSPDGQLLASASVRTVQLWDPVTGALQQLLEGHVGEVQSVAFSPDGQLLASASDDKTVRLWDPVTGAQQQLLEGHTDVVWSMAFSPDGQLLASVSFDNTVRLWNLATGALQQLLESHTGQVQSVTFSPDGQLLASASVGTVQLWNPGTGALKQLLKGHTDWVLSVAFSPDGQLLASASFDKTVRLWDPATRTLQDSATGAQQQLLAGHTGQVLSIAFSPDGQLLASASFDNTVRLWDSATGIPRQLLENHTDSVLSVAFSPDCQLLASASFDKTVQLWDPATGALQRIFEGYNRITDGIDSVVFSPDGQLLASASSNKVQVWNPATGVLQQLLEGHTDWVWSVAFSLDGQLLASSSDDKTVRLWDPATGLLQATLSTEGTVTGLEFSQDGSHLNTDLGRLDLPSRFCSYRSSSAETNSVILLQRDNWIALNGKPVLWLPPEIRPTSSAVKANTIALGQESGRIFFIGFRL